MEEKNVIQEKIPFYFKNWFIVVVYIITGIIAGVPAIILEVLRIRKYELNKKKSIVCLCIMALFSTLYVAGLFGFGSEDMPSPVNKPFTVDTTEIVENIETETEIDIETDTDIDTDYETAVLKIKKKIEKKPTWKNYKKYIEILLKNEKNDQILEVVKEYFSSVASEKLEIKEIEDLEKTLANTSVTEDEQIKSYIEELKAQVVKQQCLKKGHQWEEATCENPRTCSVCGEQEGGLAEHQWQEANCSTPKTCLVCGKTEGETAKHQWKEATCQKPKTCSVCGKTKGEPAEHNWKKELTKEPTMSEDGEITITCADCKKIKGTEPVYLEEYLDEYGASCDWSYSYNEIARNPESVKGNRAGFFGKVSQVIESGSSIVLMMNITQDEYGFWDDLIMVKYTRSSDMEQRILEGDMIYIYGELDGMQSYNTVLGASKTVPKFKMKYYSFN